MEGILNHMKLSKIPGSNRDYYNVKGDYVCVKGDCPLVLLHEIAHATGHPSRLNREGIRQYLTKTADERCQRTAIIEEMIACDAAYALMIMLDMPITEEIYKKHSESLALYCAVDVEYKVEVLQEVERVLEYLSPLVVQETTRKGE